MPIFKELIAQEDVQEAPAIITSGVWQDGASSITAFYTSSTQYTNTGDYNIITVSFKTDDKQYKIIELSGFIYASYGECKKKRESIDKETRLLFKNLTRNATGDHKHYLDKSTKVNHIVYQFSNNGYISLTCYDWSKKSGYNDQLRLEIYSNEYLEWLKSLKS